MRNDLLIAYLILSEIGSFLLMTPAVVPHYTATIQFNEVI